MWYTVVRELKGGVEGKSTKHCRRFLLNLIKLECGV